jgi:hypothetical protein
MAIIHKQDSLESRIIKLEAKNGSTPPKKGGGSPGKTPKDTGPGAAMGRGGGCFPLGRNALFPCRHRVVLPFLPQYTIPQNAGL